MVSISMKAQQTLGTAGYLLIPSADMYEAGTFNGGVSVIQKGLTAWNKTFYTGIYYIDFTPFSFIELALRETLLDYRKGHGFRQQDRSLSIRLRPIKEKEGKWWPSVVIGANDFYNDHGSSVYQGYYLVLSKRLNLSSWGSLAFTAGYVNHFGYKLYKNSHNTCIYKNGVFGGLSYTIPLKTPISIDAEWDTRGLNIGARALLWKHLGLMCYTKEFKGVCGGISYQYTLKY